MRRRLVDQNDCRTTDLAALGAHGPIDLHWLQFSGAIWYPMVYEETPEHLRELCDAKVESQFARAMRYVEALGARAVVPSAGPPCFLDPELFGFNVIDGDELSIFPDQRAFLDRLRRTGTGQRTAEHPRHGDRRHRRLVDRHPPAARRRRSSGSSPTSASTSSATPATGRRGSPTRRRAGWRRPPTCSSACGRGGSRCWRWHRPCGRRSVRRRSCAPATLERADRLPQRRGSGLDG